MEDTRVGRGGGGGEGGEGGERVRSGRVQGRGELGGEGEGREKKKQDQDSHYTCKVHNYVDSIQQQCTCTL